MATENKQIQLWSQTAATWTGSNPTLLAGQVGVESDTLKFKIGNGSTAWTSLSYAGGAITGDQTSIVGISGTKAQFDTACSDGNFVFVGDITQYTDELAQDAVGAMVDASLVYVDGTPLLQRAALTGDVTAAAGSNAMTIANGAVTYAKMQNVSATSRFLGRITSGAGSTEELTGAQATTLLDAFTSSLQGVVPASGGGTSNYLRADGTWAAPAVGGIPDAVKTELFGDGSDGDLTVTTTNATSGPITSGSLTRDAYFDDLTISGSGRIITKGWRIFVRGTLDITAAPANAISCNANNGGNASGSSAGATSSALSSSTIGGGQASTAGAAGVTGVGANATAVASSNNYFSGTNAASAGGSGAAGGAGTAGAGGTITASGSIAVVYPIRILDVHLIRGATVLIGGEAGTGGSSGAGDAASVSGGGGGGGGEGGRVGGIWAQVISRGGSTAAGAISYKGGTGGNGGNSAGAGAGGTGGGGGGGGGCGGFIYIVAGSLTGSTATNAIDASGGAGGNGGNGAGTGGGGNGGSSGHGGRIHVFDISNTTTICAATNGSAGSAGSAASGTSGGAGAAANTLQANL